MSKEAAPTKSF